MDNPQLAEALAANLRAARARLDLSQGEVAGQAKVALMSISRYENGVTLPSIDVLYRLAGIYGVDAPSLLPPSASLDDLPKRKKK